VADFREALAASRDRITAMLAESSPLQRVGSAALRAYGSSGRQSFGELMEASNQQLLQNEMAMGDMLRADRSMELQENQARRAEAMDMVDLATTLTQGAEPGSMQRLLQYWDEQPEDFSQMEAGDRISALISSASGAGIRPATERFQSGRHIIERDPVTGAYNIVFSTPQDVAAGSGLPQTTGLPDGYMWGRDENGQAVAMPIPGLEGAPGAAAFEGTGVDQQSYNHLIDITQRMARGEQLSLEDTLTYNSSYQAVTGMQEIRRADGSVGLVPGQAPAGMPSPQEVADYTRNPQPWAPAAPADGTTVSAPPRMDPTMASRVASAEVALQNLDQLQGLLYDQGGNLRQDVLATSDLASFGLSIPGSEGRSARQITRGLVEVMLRARTGAAAPDAEVERYTDLYAPTSFDSEEDIQRKLNNLRQEIGSTIEYLTGVPPAPGAPLPVSTPTPPAPVSPPSGDLSAMPPDQVDLMLNQGGIDSLTPEQRTTLSGRTDLSTTAQFLLAEPAPPAASLASRPIETIEALALDVNGRERLTQEQLTEILSRDDLSNLARFMFEGLRSRGQQ
jgi:hypothetical protein